MVWKIFRNFSHAEKNLKIALPELFFASRKKFGATPSSLCSESLGRLIAPSLGKGPYAAKNTGK